MGSIKDFAALKPLRAELKARDEARRLAEQQRQQQLQQKEINLFHQSIGMVTPLRHADRVHLPSPPPLPIPRQHLADEEAALQESLSDEFTPDTLLDSDDSLSFVRPGIGRDVLHKLRRGHWVIQAQLDLHGLRRDQAREALSQFLRQARRSGLRSLRVIHGKGNGSLNKEPVLKHKVRNWLAQKEEVIAFCQARATDGGSGALIVLLRSTNSMGNAERGY